MDSVPAWPEHRPFVVESRELVVAASVFVGSFGVLPQEGPPPVGFAKFGDADELGNEIWIRPVDRAVALVWPG